MLVTRIKTVISCRERDRLVLHGFNIISETSTSTLFFCLHIYNKIDIWKIRMGAMHRKLLNTGMNCIIGELEDKILVLRPWHVNILFPTRFLDAQYNLLPFVFILLAIVVWSNLTNDVFLQPSS